MVSEPFDSGDPMSTRSEIDQVWNQMQQGVRRMRPLVVEQQPERDMRFPKPAMVVQERCSRSSYLERMEKYWTERWIEIALAGGTSMEEIEEIRAFVNYDRPVRTLEEERKARLEMLEECRRMIEREDEEDAAKKSREEETFAAEDSDLGHVEGSLKSLCPLLEPIQLTLERKNELADDHQVASQETQNGKTLICWDRKVEPYFERGKDASKKLLETKREKCAHQVFEQMAEGDVRETTNEKEMVSKQVPELAKQLRSHVTDLKKREKWKKHKAKQKQEISDTCFSNQIVFSGNLKSKEKTFTKFRGWRFRALEIDSGTLGIKKKLVTKKEVKRKYKHQKQWKHVKKRLPVISVWCKRNHCEKSYFGSVKLLQLVGDVKWDWVLLLAVKTKKAMSRRELLTLGMLLYFVVSMKYQMKWKRQRIRCKYRNMRISWEHVAALVNFIMKLMYTKRHLWNVCKRKQWRNQVTCSINELFVVIIPWKYVMVVMTHLFTGRKRAKFKKNLISNRLGWLKMRSPPGMSGKKTSFKSFCGFVFLLHISENQIRKSVLPPHDVEHLGSETVHGIGNCWKVKHVTEQYELLLGREGLEEQKLQMGNMAKRLQLVVVMIQRIFKGAVGIKNTREAVEYKLCGFMTLFQLGVARKRNKFKNLGRVAAMCGENVNMNAALDSQIYCVIDDFAYIEMGNTNATSRTQWLKTAVNIKLKRKEQGEDLRIHIFCLRDSVFSVREKNKHVQPEELLELRAAPIQARERFPKTHATKKKVDELKNCEYGVCFVALYLTGQKMVMGCKFREKGRFVKETLGSFVLEMVEVTAQGDDACATKVRDTRAKPIEKVKVSQGFSAKTNSIEMTVEGLGKGDPEIRELLQREETRLSSL
ncbi:hypothetical protein IGI04_032073 [Brassica rapa subsp. trilocularis]|uniref:DUF287 domain-containing protein n=1 Tax=Brassica rapa subsp. trilocularis TaxID=1813537 RepID=A0ABQ7LVE6_BRACM|nr:hypothetical protein IGI04_032073 [Brassica rapa subsp. trilocularis]